MTDSSRWRAVDTARLAWEQDNSPRSEDFDDVYYSSGSGIAETRHVFIDGNDLRRRMSELDCERLTIAETGFGSGLNFLCSWDCWRQQGARPGVLHFLSIEKFPLRIEDLGRALSAWPELAPLSEQLLQQYPAPFPGQHRLVFEQGRVILDLVLADATQALQDWEADPALRVDAWFLDGFAPARNPDMWSDDLYSAMARLSAPGASLATFTAAGHVRRGLEANGFRIRKLPGFGHKREMIRGEYPAPSPVRPLRETPWHIQPPPTATAKKAMVIGAGLAGCSVAHSLARRGWQVQVFDAGACAGGASGNQQGVLYTRLSHRYSELSQFSLHSFRFSTALYRAFMRQGFLESGRDGEFCGVLHLQEWPEDHPLWETARRLPELVRYLGPEEASKASGLAECPPGLWFHGAGWLNPPAVCRALLQHEHIELRENCGQLQVTLTGDCWTVQDSPGQSLSSAPVAIIACGHGSSAVTGLDWLPCQPIRGQVTHLPSRPGLDGLKTVICDKGYIAPAREGEHCIGATFDIRDEDPSLRDTDHRRNLETLREDLGVESTGVEPGGLGGKVGFRYASPDYLPLAGPVPDYPHFLENYAALRSNARRVIPGHGSYLPGLYLSTGHGSRGLTSAPICAELIASQVCGEASPLEPVLVRALSPARFPIRDLVRNRV